MKMLLLMMINFRQSGSHYHNHIPEKNILAPLHNSQINSISLLVKGYGLIFHSMNYMNHSKHGYLHKISEF